MKVEINKKTIEIPDKEIKQFMKSLDITIVFLLISTFIVSTPFP